MNRGKHIVVAIVAGIALGILLGPESPFFTRDTILVRQPDTVLLIESPGGKPTPFQFSSAAPADSTRAAPTRFFILGETVLGDTTYYNVSFKLTEKLALRIKGNDERIGERIVAWVAADTVSNPTSGLGHRLVGWCTPIGALFLRLIEMIVVPLVFASLVVAVASLKNVRQLSRYGSKSIIYFVITTSVSISIGLVAANIVRPGRFVSQDRKAEMMKAYSGDAEGKQLLAANAPSTIDTLLEIVPKNPFAALAKGNMLQTIFFALALGIALTVMGRKKTAPFVGVMETLYDAMIVLVEMIMRMVPVAVFALMFKLVGETGLSVIPALAAYMATVIGGLFLHTGFYTLVVRSFGKISIRDFWRVARAPQLLGFTTTSSGATLPVTMNAAQKGLGISPQVASFILPLGATINMDGTALYQGVAAVFISQVFGIPLSLQKQAKIVLTATLASIGTAGIPSSGIIMLTLVLTSIGIPRIGLALILGVDRILDMFRTAVNITGDLSAAVIIASTEGETLKAMPDLAERTESKQASAE